MLFTPGPLTTSPTVKQKMLVDVGSRDEVVFLGKMHDVRKRLTHAANVTQDTHDCVLIQGAGTHAIESVLVRLQGFNSFIMNSVVGQCCGKSIRCGVESPPYSQ